MATVDSKSIIRKLLENNGVYPGDPQVYSVWQYVTDWGQKTCAVFYNRAHVDIHESPHVHDPELLWSAEVGLTNAGKLWLSENRIKGVTS